MRNSLKLFIVVTVICISFSQIIKQASILKQTIRAEFIPGVCKSLNTTYISAVIELEWKNISKYMNSISLKDYCKILYKYPINSIIWRIQEVNNPKASWFSSGLYKTHLSKFIHWYSCGQQAMKFTTYIEPLMGALRHPKSICEEDLLFSREYLVLANANNFPQGFVRNVILFDLGASTWKAGAGGASQSFFYNEYRKRGMLFDRTFLWEAAATNISDIFKDIPKAFYHAYQYFNFPADDDPASAANPLNILQQVSKTYDFVVFKIDIDNAMAESSFMNQILSNNAVSSLIDEIYFEHHINFPPLVNCCWGGTIEPQSTLYTSYKLFHELRTKGIRAHGWP